MQPWDYSKAKDIDDVITIIEGLCNESLKARYDDLFEYAAQCETAMEFGINQGSSLAAILRAGPKTVIGVDVELKPYNIGGLKPIMEEYAKKEDINLKIVKGDSTKIAPANVEFLHIDSLHSPKHLEKELKIHAPFVSKYIMFHDIKQKDYELMKVIEKYVSNNPEWAVIVKYEVGKCGHAVIKRK